MGLGSTDLTQHSSESFTVPPGFFQLCWEGGILRPTGTFWDALWFSEKASSEAHGLQTHQNTRTTRRHFLLCLEVLWWLQPTDLLIGRFQYLWGSGIVSWEYWGPLVLGDRERYRKSQIPQGKLKKESRVQSETCLLRRKALQFQWDFDASG